MGIIEVHELIKRYGGDTAVDGVTFQVEQGEIFGILGPNGAGKTTTVECIEGLREPDGGDVRVLGREPHDPKLRYALGAQLQESELPEKIKVREAMELYASFYRGPADWRELLDTLGLAEKREAKFKTLSGGQKQRLSIALALIGQPKIAVLDELTTGLDPQARRDVWDLIEQVRDSGVTVLLVTHFMEEAERLCDRLAVIDSGRVVAIDTPAGLVSRVDDEQRIRFRPSAPLDERLLTALPEVRTVSRPASNSWSPAPATCCTPSPRCWPATRSSPPTSGSNRPASTTPSSPSPAASSTNQQVRGSSRPANRAQKHLKRPQTSGRLAVVGDDHPWGLQVLKTPKPIRQGDTL